MTGSWDVGGFIAGAEALSRRVQAEKMAALKDVAEYVLGESIQQVPHEEGDLQSSGKVSVDEGSSRVAVSYDTPYAVRQHEDMTYRHDAGRKAKYLEDPLNAAAKGPAKKIIERRLKGT